MQWVDQAMKMLPGNAQSVQVCRWIVFHTVMLEACAGILVEIIYRATFLKRGMMVCSNGGSL
jgi:hypothetical protein